MNPEEHEPAEIAWLWSGRELAAFISPDRFLTIIGVVALGFDSAMIVGSLAASVEEPYQRIVQGFATAVEIGMFVGLFSCLLFGIVAAVAHLTAYALFGPAWWPRTRLNALFLSPLCLVLPLLTWSPFAVLVSVSRPSVQIYGPDGQLQDPAVLHSPVVQVLGSSWWLLAFVGFLILYAMDAVRNVRPPPSPDEPRCARCDYILIGLPIGRCPECGEPFELPPAKERDAHC